MTDPNSQTKEPREQRRYDQKQFEILSRCNAEKNMSAWNEWREENPHEPVLLEGASFWHAHLKGANLQGANLVRADLRGANLEGARLQNAVLWEARLQKANLRETCLQHAKFMRTQLQGAEFGGAKLQGADFSRAIVDGETLIWRCGFDRRTKFEGVALGQMRIYPKEKELFEYNMRRMNWEEWYNKGRLWQRIAKRVFIWPFWWISDYGISTKRIIFVFLGLALFFAVIYSNLSCWFAPGVVSNLEIEPFLPLWQYGVVVFLRPIYFSVVTMTTLGFGDMYANAQSIWGHILLTIQVILGYVLLGALITRFAVLFTAGGPAGKFSDEEKEDDEKR